MRVRLAFGSWFEADEDHMPTLIAACDEYTEDDWNGIPEFYADDVEKHRQENGEVRECFIDVPDSAVRRLFATVTVPATVVGQERTGT